MIKGLIAGLGKYKEMAIIWVLSIATFTWGIGQLGEFLNPRAFNQALEEKILQAEGRSKAYVDDKTSHGEKLANMQHKAVMRAIGNIETSINGLHNEVLNLYKERGKGSAASIELEPCGVLKCL